MAEVDQVAIQRHTISVFRVIIVDKVKPSQILQFLVAPLPSLQGKNCTCLRSRGVGVEEGSVS